MPQQAWSNKRERQYEHIKEGLEDQGRDEDTAEEIAARTVNKERARAGESEQASTTSTDDISSGRRGGLRSHSGDPARLDANHNGIACEDYFKTGQSAPGPDRGPKPSPDQDRPAPPVTPTTP